MHAPPIYAEPTRASKLMGLIMKCMLAAMVLLMYQEEGHKHTGVHHKGQHKNSEWIPQETPLIIRPETTPLPFWHDMGLNITETDSEAEMQRQMLIVKQAMFDLMKAVLAQKFDP